MPQSRRTPLSALLALLVPTLAHADPLLISGTGVEIAYGADGLAFDPDEEEGILGYVGSTPDWYDFTYYGGSSTTIDPFLASSFSYDLGGETFEYAGYIKGLDSSSSSVDWTTTSSADISADGLLGVEYVWEVGDLEVVKTETWDEDGYAVLVHFSVTNTSEEDIENFAYLHLVDPADSTGSLNSTNTRNDLQDNDGDGVKEYAQSQGRSTTTRTNNRTIAMGLCDPGSEEVNYKSGVEVYVTDAVAAGFDDDPDGASSDQQMVYLHTEDSIAAGDTILFALVIAIGTNEEGALEAFGVGEEGCWDLDGDGELSEEFGGDDCDDEDGDVYSGADEIWYDGYDQDCGEDDDYDQDADGYADAEYADEYGPTLDPGTGEEIDGTGELDVTDCDDEDSGVNEGTEEIWYDGYDQDCGEDDDYDQDADGYADAEHADEYGPTRNPSTGEEIDGTGELDATDCDDEDEDVNAGADEIWYDGYDQDCGEDDDYDQDADGYADAGHADDYGPTLNPGTGDEIRGTGNLDTTDCDDEDEDVNAGADEIWYDGYDQDCGEDDDYDQDADGSADADHADDYGPTRVSGTDEEIDGTGELDADDCNDEDAGVGPGQDETWYDGVDADCAGDDDYDQDADGHADIDHADEYGPTFTDFDHDDEVDGTGELSPDDCDDADPAITLCDLDKIYRGGGGCTCASSGSTPGREAGLLGLLTAGLGLWSRRRRPLKTSGRT